MPNSISNYNQGGNSKSITNIDGKQFTIVGVEDSVYKDKNDEKPSVIITTAEAFNVEGEEYNRFHTTRTAIVNQLKNEKLRQDLENGTSIGPVVCKWIKNPQNGGKPYWALVDPEDE